MKIKTIFLVAIEEIGQNYIVSYVDLSTGEINVMNIDRNF